MMNELYGACDRAVEFIHFLWDNVSTEELCDVDEWESFDDYDINVVGSTYHGQSPTMLRCIVVHKDNQNNVLFSCSIGGTW